MPAPPRKLPPQPEAETGPEVPPYYVATAPLPYGPPGAFRVLAFQTGDHVPPDMVEPNRWGDRVKVPAEFAGVLPEPPQPADPGGGKEE